MKKIKISLEYRCFPIWVYDENNNLIDNDLPITLLKDKNIDMQCVEIQEIFNKLYLDNGIEFKYIGFNDIVKRTEFLNKVKNIELTLREKVGLDYNIENDVKLDNL